MATVPDVSVSWRTASASYLAVGASTPSRPRRPCRLPDPPREDEAESRRRIAHNVLDVVPVLDLGGVLLTRDHRPLPVVDATLGEEHLRPRQGNVLNAMRVSGHGGGNRSCCEARSLARPCVRIRQHVGL